MKEPLTPHRPSPLPKKIWPQVLLTCALGIRSVEKVSTEIYNNVLQSPSDVSAWYAD